MNSINMCILIVAFIASAEAGSRELGCVYRGDVNQNPSDINFSGCDKIYYSFDNLGCNSSGALVWRQDIQVVAIQLSALRKIASENSCKLILGFDPRWTDEWAGFKAVYADAGKYYTLMTNLYNAALLYGFDGINIDLRYFNSAVGFTKADFNNFVNYIYLTFSSATFNTIFISLEHAPTNDCYDWDLINSLDIQITYFFAHFNTAIYQHLAAIHRKAEDPEWSSIDEHFKYIRDNCSVAVSKIHLVVQTYGLVYDAPSSTKLVVNSAATINRWITFGQYCQNQYKYSGLGGLLGGILNAIFSGLLEFVKDDVRSFGYNYYSRSCVSIATKETTAMLVSYAKTCNVRGLLVFNLDSDNNVIQYGDSIRSCAKNFRS